MESATAQLPSPLPRSVPEPKKCLAPACTDPLHGRQRKYCSVHGHSASLFWKRDQRRLSREADALRNEECQSHPYWLDAWWAKKATQGQTARAAYNAYMSRYMRRRRASRLARAASNSSKGSTVALLLMLVTAVLWPLNVFAAVLVFCLDVSGSMNVDDKITGAKAALIEQVHQAQAGDVVYVITFAIGNHLLGRLEVGEDGNTAEKEALVVRIKSLRAGGPAGAHTNLDEALQGAKSALLMEPAPGTRKIIVLSDGVSDPSTDHEKLDLAAIASMVPQGSWALYIVGLPGDIAGLFRTPAQPGGLIVAPKHPNVMAIPITQFSRERIEAAVTAAKDEPVIVVTPTSIGTQEQTLESPSTPIQTTTASKVASPKPWSSAIAAWIVASLALVALPLPIMWLRKAAPEDLLRVVIEIDEGAGSEPRRYPIAFAERTTKTIGPRGDIALSDSELPPIVCTLERRRGQLWLAPQDTVTINGEPIATNTALGIGDVIQIRQCVTLRIDDPREEES